MANRNNRQPMGNRRMDFGRLDRSKGYGRPMPVSPWQTAAPMGNILPLATSSEATLALANNLINNLLQSRQNTVPPSLLDMPIRRDFGVDMNRGFDRGYNRMGNQANFRRPSGNYVRPADRPNNYRKPFRPNDGQRNKPNQFQRKDNADSKAKPVKVESNEPEVKESQVKEEPKEDGVKDEAKEETAEAGATDAAPAPEEEKKEAPKTAYDGINPALLHCHICNKTMWDGRSFENHLNGRAHHIMMQKASESYALTSDTMRQELKIREMKYYRNLGQSASRNFFCAMCDTYAADGAAHRTTTGHRKLKKYLHPACASCHKEMPTRIELDEHRLTVEHLMTVQGRRKEFTAKPKPEVMVISTLTTEESYVRYDRCSRARRQRGPPAVKEEPKDKEEGADEAKPEDAVEESAGEGDEEKKDEDVDMEKAAEGEKAEDSDATVVDVKEGDDLSGITPEMIPSYKPERGVGRSFLADFTCVHCKLCRKLLDTPETAEVHLRTWRHHLLFVKHLQRRNRPDGEGKTAAPAKNGEEDEEKTEPADVRATAPSDNSGKRTVRADEDTDGNWKRRKTTPDHEMDKTNGDDGEDADETAGDNGEEAPSSETHDVEMREQEQWERDLELVMKDVTDDGDADNKGEEDPAKEAEPEKVEEEPTPAKVSPKTARGRGRGRGRGARRT